MKRNILFILITFFSVATASAQLSLTEDVIISEVNDGDTDIAGYSKVVNESGSTKTYTWTRNVVSIESGWTSAICDKNQCYLTTTNSMDFEMVSEEEGDMIVHVYPPNGGENASQGSAVIEVNVVEADNSSQSVTGIYYFNASPNNTTTVEKQVVRVYPNPSRGLFSVQDNGVANRVAIYNVAGRQVKLFDASANDQFDIRDLPKGTYFVQLISKSGEIFSTKLLNKI
jgi:hypothetical protein